jgi:23S rRNA U2552 (ribose-2'-O)-methylase RlmE/FtsJ
MSDLNALADRHYAAGDSTRKPLSYLLEYERILTDLRDKEARILELGVSSGASLLMWKDYLPRGVIVGLDIDPMPRSIAGEGRIHFIRASQDDTAALDKAAEIAGGAFDLIIDDASHLGYLTKRSFQYLFPNLLKPGGTYAIEDFCTGFLPEYPDGSKFVEPPAYDTTSGTRVFESHQFGMVGVVKQLIDHMARELMTGQSSWLSIEKLIIRTNLALIEKSTLPAGPPPSRQPGDTDMPAQQHSDGGISVLGEDIRRLDRRLSDLESVGIHPLAARIVALEKVIDRVGQVINWLRPWRKMALRRFK